MKVFLNNSTLIKCIPMMVIVFMGCQKKLEKGTFGYDLNYLEDKASPILLKDGERQIIISAKFQGRILTSKSNGLKGKSYGWFNNQIISSDSVNTNRSKLGGEGRIWFGPDQGPNTLFFDIDPNTGEKIHAAPKDLDTLSFHILKQTETFISLGQKLHFENYQNFHFYIDLIRNIEILKKQSIQKNLGLELKDGLNYVAYKAETQMKNIGNKNWNKDKGLMCLWELGCMQPTPKTTVVIPLNGEKQKATIYFTNIDNKRIILKNNTLFYKADANYLNKIGTLPEYSTPIFGSYSPELNLLTIIQFNFEGDKDYVNAHPLDIENQYKGDVINIFNDGTWGDIGPFGPFYELETSSTAKALQIGESLKHTSITYHFEGKREALNDIAISLLKVNLETIENAFN